MCGASGSHPEIALSFMGRGRGAGQPSGAFNYTRVMLHVLIGRPSICLGQKPAKSVWLLAS